MPAVATTANLIEALQQGELLTASQKEQVKELAGPRAEPKALAQELVKRGWLTAFQARQVLLGKAQALTLGPYVVLDTLGGGGVGQIYKALHRKMDRVVALKMLRQDLRKDSEAVQRFHREIEVASQLSHPNIVHAYEAGPMGPGLVLVMEHVEGQDLEQIVKRSGPLPVLQACDFVRQAAVGLQYAHERGLVHRDIKPSNLLVTGLRIADCGLRIPTREGEAVLQSAIRNPQSAIVKILDLGLARLREPLQGSATANLTLDGGNVAMQGTPDYLSPEQALDFHTADIRSDIYSLGCTLYFLLAGKPPFPGNTLAEKLMKHQQAEPPPCGRDLPAPLAKLLNKMLAKRPEDRFQSPGEVAEALAAIGAGLPSMETVPEQALPRTAPSLALEDPAEARRRGRWRAGVFASLLGGIGTIALLVVLGGGGPQVESTEPNAPTPPTVVESTTPDRLEKDKLITGLTISTGKNYLLVLAKHGNKQRIDREFRITSLSPALEGGTMIRTANDDKQVKAAEHIAFNLTGPATVYVCYDKREKNVPAWLADGSWKLTAERFNSSGEGAAGPFRVYAKSYPAGRVVLGGNQQPPATVTTGISHYVVIVKQAE